MATKDELLNKCLEGPITQKDLPSYKEAVSPVKNTTKNSIGSKSGLAGTLYLNYELNSKTEKRDENRGDSK